MSCYIQLQNVNKRYISQLVISDLTFNVNKGDVLGFLGPNGAGKTTTMRMITGYLLPSSGSIAIHQKPLYTNPTDCQQHIGYLAEGCPLYTDMTVKGFLLFIGRARGLTKPRLKLQLDYVIDQLSLSSVINQPIYTLSKGFKRRVGLAQAILHDPSILVLDEPTDGLDPIQQEEVHRLIQRISPNKAIIISTHNLSEAAMLCNRTIIINRGRKVAEGSIEELCDQKTPPVSFEHVFKSYVKSGDDLHV